MSGPEAGELGPLTAVDDLAERAPAELILLVLPADEESGAGLELRRTRRGDLAAIAFTTVQALVAACGTGQPWARIATPELERIADELGITVFAIDPVLPEGHRYPEPEVTELPDIEPVEPVDPEARLYLPSRPFRAAERRACLELQPDARGRLTLLAFTSPEMLRAGCGEHQAWVAIRAAALPDAVRDSGAERVLFNPVLAEQSRHRAPVGWVSGGR